MTRHRLKPAALQLAVLRAVARRGPLRHGAEAGQHLLPVWLAFLSYAVQGRSRHARAFPEPLVQLHPHHGAPCSPSDGCCHHQGGGLSQGPVARATIPRGLREALRLGPRAPHPDRAAAVSVPDPTLRGQGPAGGAGDSSGSQEPYTCPSPRNRLVRQVPGVPERSARAAAKLPACGGETTGNGIMKSLPELARRAARSRWCSPRTGRTSS